MAVHAKDGSAGSSGLIDVAVLAKVAPIIRNAAHPLRLRILDYLRHEGEPRTVSQIIAICGAEQAIVSQQLRILKDLGILSARRDGTFVYYTIADHSVLFLLDCIREHVNRAP
jgi:DNA-binding transcriptional ArsR family regulator